MKKVTLKLKENSYDIIIGNNIVRQFTSHIQKVIKQKDALIITNDSIKQLYGPLLQKALKRLEATLNFLIIPENEKAKSFFYLNRLLKEMATKSKGKNPFILALGGGVVGDVSGFAAAIFKRGIPYVQIPTTLLAQIDSSIGGKTAIDLSEGKNLIGSFYQPALVLINTGFLKSLPKKEIRAGLAEMIKYAVIKDSKFFNFLEKEYKNLLILKPRFLDEAIYNCCRIKAEVVSKDEREQKGLRTILNFGHTVGHAIEAASSFRYSHGEAVAIGMIAASKISKALKLIDLANYQRIFDLIKNCQLPTRIRRINLEAIMKSLSYDKKFIGRRNRFVLPLKIGKVIIKEGIRENIIRSAIKELL